MTDVIGASTIRAAFLAPERYLVVELDNGVVDSYLDGKVLENVVLDHKLVIHGYIGGREVTGHYNNDKIVRILALHKRDEDTDNA